MLKSSSRRAAAALAAAVTLAPALACRDARDWRRVFADYARPDTVERLHSALDGERARGDTARRLNRALAEKNRRLLAQVGDLARIVNDIDRDLSGFSGRGRVLPLFPGGELADDSTEQSEHEAIEERRQRIAANLDRLTRTLERTRSLYRAATARDSMARAELASSAETLEMFRMLAENRALQFAEASAHVDSLALANRELTDERDRMRDSLMRLSARVSRVYYAVGTREEHLASGVAREMVVARKNWKGWQRERQLVLAREPDLARLAAMHTAFAAAASDTTAADDGGEVEQQSDQRPAPPGAFRELDRYRDTLLAIPAVRRGRLRVLSGQESRYAEGLSRDGRLTGASGRLHVADPEAFWEGGRYLVLIIER